MLTILLIVLLVLALFGGLGQQQYGPYIWSPAVLILALLGVLYYTGNLGHIK